MVRIHPLARAVFIACLAASAAAPRSDAQSALAAATSAALRPAPIEAFLPRQPSRLASLSPYEWWSATASPGRVADPARRREPPEPRDSRQENGEWISIPPPQLWQHDMFYDAQRDWMVMLGGMQALRPQSAVWILRGDGGQGWERIEPAGTAPPAGSAAMVFDSRRERVLHIMNGFTPGTPVGVHALSLRSRPEWSEVVATGAPGSILSAAVAAYDPDGDRVFVFGTMASQGEVVRSLQVLSLGSAPSWSSIPFVGDGPAGPSTAAAWDRPRNRMLVLTWSGELWELRVGSPSVWTRLDLPLSGESGMTIDAASNRLLVVDDRRQVWATSLSGTPKWKAIGGAEDEWSLRMFALAIDTRRNRLVVHGGTTGYSSLSKTRSLRLAGDTSWEDATTSGAARVWHSALFDRRNDQMVVFGGWSVNEPADNSAAALTMHKEALWSALDAVGPGPRPRFGQAMIRDDANGRLIVFGGQAIDGTGDYLGDVWALPLDGRPRWSELTPANGPGVRRFAAAVYDSRRNRMLAFFGDDRVRFRQDVWALSLDGEPAWSPVTIAGEPPPGSYVSAYYDRRNDRVVICAAGGAVWSVSLGATPRYEALAPAGEAPPPEAAAMVHDTRRNRILWFRANPLSGNFALDECWALSLDRRPGWTRLVPKGLAPPPRYLMSVVYDELHDRALFYGGYQDLVDYFGDTWALSWSNPDDVVPGLAGQPRGKGLGLHGLVAVGAGFEATVTLPEAGAMSLELYDIQGRRLLARRIEAEAGTHGVRIEPPGPLTSGIYLVRVVQGRESTTARAIVLR